MPKAVHDSKDSATLELRIDDILDLGLGIAVNTVGVKVLCKLLT